MKDLIDTPRLSVGETALTLAWPDGAEGTYPYIWLRDNCPSGFHPDTGERVGNLMDLPEAPELLSGEIEGDTLHLVWTDDGAESHFPLAWLHAHTPGRVKADAADGAPHVWRADLGAEGIPRFAAQAVAEDDAVLADWLSATVATGLSIIEGLEDRPEAGMEIARRIGFLRRTNFGIEFEVRSKPDPNNLAYTALALPLHTDLANQEVPPGYQFLHCIANEAEGGGSVFADGYAMALDLKEKDPEAYDLLANTAIPFWFHDGETDLRIHKPVINLDAHGALSEIKWNAHLAGVFDMAPEEMPAYYRAYRAFMAQTRDPAYQVTLKLGAGEMVVFDNRRVLHGRSAFDPSTGRRHLQGCYVDRGEFHSRLRVLSRG